MELTNGSDKKNLYMLCDNITLLFRFVPFHIKQKGRTVLRTVCSVRFILSLSGETMVSKLMRSCGLQISVRVKGWLWQGFVASVSHT